jgi:hypothetical protein
MAAQFDTVPAGALQLALHPDSADFVFEAAPAGTIMDSGNVPCSPYRSKK